MQEQSTFPALVNTKCITSCLPEDLSWDPTRHEGSQQLWLEAVKFNHSCANKRVKKHGFDDVILFSLLFSIKIKHAGKVPNMDYFFFFYNEIHVDVASTVAVVNLSVAAEFKLHFYNEGTQPHPYKG